MQHESEPTPFKPTNKKPVLRLDDRGRAAAAIAVKEPLVEWFAVYNKEFVELTPSNAPNVVIDRLPGEVPRAPKGPRRVGFDRGQP